MLPYREDSFWKYVLITSWCILGNITMNPKILKLLSIKILRIQMYSEEIWSVRFPVTKTCPLTVTYNYVICTLIVIIMHYEMIVTYCKRDDFKYTMILAIITIKYWYFFLRSKWPQSVTRTRGRGSEDKPLYMGRPLTHQVLILDIWIIMGRFIMCCVYCY